VRLAIALVLTLAPACAMRSKTPEPPPVRSYLFSDKLPPDTLVCVPRDPLQVLEADRSCITVDELRAWLRRRRLA
jgi:hypothetical protein